jgi:hypothetical protein
MRSRGWEGGGEGGIIIDLEISVQGWSQTNISSYLLPTLGIFICYTAKTAPPVLGSRKIIYYIDVFERRHLHVFLERFRISKKVIGDTR